MQEQTKSLQELTDETKRLAKEVDRHLKALRSGTTAEAIPAKKNRRPVDK